MQATAATDYIAAHTPPTEAVLADAAIHSYAVAYWWGAGLFAVGAVLSALLFRRRTDGPSIAAPRPARDETAPGEEPAIASAAAH